MADSDFEATVTELRKTVVDVRKHQRETHKIIAEIQRSQGKNANGIMENTIAVKELATTVLGLSRKVDEASDTLTGLEAFTQDARAVGRIGRRLAKLVVWLGGIAAAIVAIIQAWQAFA